jgi:hypothetical protein
MDHNKSLRNRSFRAAAVILYLAMSSVLFFPIHDFQIDTSYPYNEEACGAGSVSKVMLDSPNTQGSIRVASIYWDQQFQIFLMFRPGKAEDNNAGVPLRRVNWGWELKALNVHNPFDPQEEVCER